MSVNKTIASLADVDEECINYLQKLTTDATLHEIYNTVAEGGTLFQVNNGIGTVTIDWTSSDPVITFNPTIAFRNGLNDVLKEGVDPLVEGLEQKVNKAVLELYKELI